MMYFIALKLHDKENENEEAKIERYAKLLEAIKALGNWSNRLGDVSCWLVQCSLSAVQVRDLLKGHLELEQGDRLFVGEFIQNWAGTGMGQGFPEWINRQSFRIIVPPEGANQG